MRTMWGLCPRCGGQFGCPCAACRKNNPEQIPVAIEGQLADGIILESCPHCGFAATIGWWANLNYDTVQGTGGFDGKGTIEDGHLFPGMAKTSPVEDGTQCPNT